MVFMFAVYLLILRSKRNIDMVPATGLSGLVTLCIAVVMMPGFAISAHDLLICYCPGFVPVRAGVPVADLGTRYLPAAEVALFALTESILNRSGSG